MKQLLLSLLLLSLTSFAFAQKGAITGKVLDKKTQEGVIGATVLVTGTVQAAPVQLDGSYRLELDSGTYALTVTYVGYKTQNFTGIVVTSGQDTPLNVALEESATGLKEVVVTGVKQTGTEVALIQDLKKSEVVVSGLSSDQIVKTLDRDAAEVVKRIPGVTIQSNNFIVIRGLPERYNTVLLNGTLTPSAEVDTRSFSFDILPSSVIDRVLIFKSGAPELPGEFGGGVVSVYTKNSVLENTTTLNVSGWARSINTFQGGFQRSTQSPTDFLGYDNGQRGLPSALGALRPTVRNPSADQTAAIGGQLRNDFLPTLSTSRPDLRFSLGLNRKFEIGRVYVSNVTSIAYSNTQEQYSSRRQRFTTYVPNQPVGKFYDFTDLRSVSAVRLGVIHNYQARLNDHNRLEFRNFFNQYATDEVVRRRGLDETTGTFQERDDYGLHYQSRTIYSGQLGGSHALGATRNSTLSWALGYNYVYRNEPDYRQNQRTRDYDPNRPGEANPAPYLVEVNDVFTTSSRFFSTMRENTYMSSGQYERRYRGRDTTSVNQFKLRVGYYAEEKERNYEGRLFNYARSMNFDQNLPKLPLSTVFSPENVRNNGGFVLRENTQDADRYRGTNRLLAAYVSGVAPISDQFSISGGVRLEYNRRRLIPGSTNTNNYEEIRTFLLPSVNATYNFNDRSLLRAGLSASVNRPEFREIAQYTYYDFSNNFLINGNNELGTARIYNADLRYEFYPSRSELLSVGVFAKRFYNAIEQTTRSTPGTDLLLTYQNATRAYDVGVEVEARKSLRELSENAFLQRFSLVLNASLIRSQVDLDLDDPKNKGFALTGRPLQGQSPYVVNLGVFYQDEEARWQVSGQYNVIGPRIAFVGDQTQNFSIFEMPRHVVDLAVTKGLGRHFEVRAGVQNLLDQEYKFLYDFDRNGRINGVEDGASFARYRRGTYSTLGLTYRL